MSSPAWRVLAAIEAELARQGAKLDRILAALEARQPRPVDPDRDSRLLAAIAGWRGAEVFAVPDLLASSDVELQAALGTIRPRQLGAQLRRISRGPCGPYQLTRIKRESAGVQWSVVYL